MKEIIVYDFDKTLTYKDTIFGFFKFVGKKDILYPLKIFLYLIAMVLSKFEIISNSQMKEFGIKIFLKNMDKNTFQKRCEEYSKTIVTNKLYDEILSKKEQCYILTGSFEEYIKFLFPDFIKIIGSKISYKNEKVDGLKFNVFKEKKIEALKKEGVESIDIFYTDSISDLEVAKISKKIFIVYGDSIVECKNIEEFRCYFDYHEDNETNEIKIKYAKVLLLKNK